MSHPTLYKIGGRGQVLQWSIEVKKRGDSGVLVMEHGQKDGKLVMDKEVVDKGKNLGQSNATTPIEQARLQAQARWKKQFDRYYRETIAEAETAAKAKSKPMLAHKYLEKKEKHLKHGEELALQPKLDGMRCIASKEDGKVVLMSRGGKVIESVPHIAAALEPLLEDGGVSFDGELYVHGMDFEKIMSICRRGFKKLHKEHETMEYHVYDIVDSQEFVTRVTKHFARIEGAKLKCVQVVDTHFDEYENGVYSIEQHLAMYEEQGYEGVMVRKLNMPYEHKRSVQLLKLKSFKDEEFRIVGSEDGKAGSSKENIFQTAICTNNDHMNPNNDPGWWDGLSAREQNKLMKDGEVFGAPLIGSEGTLAGMWSRRGKYVGELATVVFQEKTKRGNPRFPKTKAIRGKEDLSS